MKRTTLISLSAVAALCAMSIAPYCLGASQRHWSMAHPDRLGKTVIVPKQLSIDGHTYKLTYHDEFNGKQIDKDKWVPRFKKGANKPRKMFFTPKASWLDGQGNLVMSMFTKPRSAQTSKIAMGRWAAYTSCLKTRQQFTYGFFQVRMKMPIVKGVGIAIWMQSHGMTGKHKNGDPAVGTEIDLIEQTFFSRYGKPNDYKHIGAHWGGYHKFHQWFHVRIMTRKQPPENKDGGDAQLEFGKQLNLGDTSNGLIHIRRRYYSDTLNFRDSNYHTVALLWTPKYYKYFMDHELVATTSIPISQSPEFMILYPRLFNFDKLVAHSKHGLGDLEHTKAKYKIDYFRVYQQEPRISLQPGLRKNKE